MVYAFFKASIPVCHHVCGWLSVWCVSGIGLGLGFPLLLSTCYCCVSDEGGRDDLTKLHYHYYYIIMTIFTFFAQIEVKV